MPKSVSSIEGVPLRMFKVLKIHRQLHAEQKNGGRREQQKFKSRLHYRFQNQNCKGPNNIKVDYTTFRTPVYDDLSLK